MTGAPPLAGIRVLDFTHAAAGPYLTMFLADLGAEVVKVEKPGRGDGSRTMGEPILGTLNSDYFVSINRSKKGIALDLGTEEGVRIARRLVESADVVAQNFRPGVMDRLGLGFADLAPLRPGLVYCSISAFGPSGPLHERPANDIIMQSVSGLMSVTGEFGGGPVKIGVPACDYASGLFGLSGVLAALFARDAHPEGQHVEIAMLNAAVAFASNYVPRVLTLGRKTRRMGAQHPQIVPYQAFACADGEHVMVGAFTSEFWRRLCRAVGRPEWIEDERYRYNSRRLEHREELIAAFEELFRARTRDEWLEILGAADVPCSPVLEMSDALVSEQAVHNGVTLRIEDGDRHVDVADSPIRSAQWRRPEPTLPPSLGRDTVEVLRDLAGLPPEEIETLLDKGIVASSPGGAQNRGGPR